MGRGPLPKRRPKLPLLHTLMCGSTSGISPSFLGLSRSSGQVTHVLLTRSRLCPRPKPGSSLHLHVLGTPPAFVLSQDQTLREELQDRPHSATCFTKSRRGPVRHERTFPPWRGGQTTGLSLEGSGPCVLTRGPDVHQRDPGRTTGLQSGTAVRRPGRPVQRRRRS